MFFYSNQNDLLESLLIVEKGIPSKTTMQVLDGIFLEAKNGNLIFCSNNLEMGITAVLDKVRIEEEGSVILPGKFIDILKQLPDKELEIKMDNEDLRVEIKSGKAHFFLYGMNAEEFPYITKEEEWQGWNRLYFSAEKLRDLLTKVTFAVSQDEGKPTFRGVLMEFDNESKLVILASDTFRLARVERHFIDFKDTGPFRLLVPGKTFMEISKILDISTEQVKCFFNENEMVMVYKNFIFSSRLLENKFPDLSGVFPSSFETRIKVNKELLEKMLQRAVLLAQGFNQMVSLKIKDKILGVKAGSEIGRMDEELQLEEQEGADLDEILLNARYILEAFRVVEDKIVELEFNGSLGPCILKTTKEIEENPMEYKYLVLPIKIEKKDEY